MSSYHQLDLSEIRPPSPRNEQVHSDPTAVLAAAVAQPSQPLLHKPHQQPQNDIHSSLSALPTQQDLWSQPPSTSDILIFPTLTPTPPLTNPEQLFPSNSRQLPVTSSPFMQQPYQSNQLAPHFSSSLPQPHQTPLHISHLDTTQLAPHIPLDNPHNKNNNHIQVPSSPTLSTLSATVDGLNAVERAKKSAEDFTRSQLAKKKRKARAEDGSLKKRKGSDGSSCSDHDIFSEDNGDAAPEKVSHRKYQKRLQKNRDSAFVSRIRRREYTKILENSLTITEQEKNRALSNYMEMKRKFDLVTAELNALRQAASSNMTNVRNAMMTRMNTQPTADAANPHVPRSSSVVTTMFMFTLMFGVMVPETAQFKSGLSSRLWGSRNVVATGSAAASKSLSNIRMQFSSFSLRDKSMVKGQVWGLSSAAKMERNKQSENDAREVLAGKVRDRALHVHGLAKSQKLVRKLRNRLGVLSVQQVERLDGVFMSEFAVEKAGAGKLEEFLKKAGVGDWEGEGSVRGVVNSVISGLRNLLSGFMS